MKNKIAIVGLCLAVAFPLLAQKKEDQRLADSATVMKELSQGDNGLPKSVLNQAMCASLSFQASRKLPLVLAAVTGAACSCAARAPRWMVSGARQ